VSLPSFKYNQEGSSTPRKRHGLACSTAIEQSPRATAPGAAAILIWAVADAQAERYFAADFAAHFETSESVAMQKLWRGGQ
jgi:hypothetical protein